SHSFHRRRPPPDLHSFPTRRSSDLLTRALQVATKPKSITSVPGGMVARASINLKGSGIFMDSFDSSDTNFSTAGAYDPKKARDRDRKSTRLNSSHVSISYAVFCLKK